jgi:tetratricopeptide (TPR) repeat protein
MFRINVELYPESWNVYDSLGEALLAAGDHESAIAMYEKSLEINPDNTNGKDMLERIRKEISVN